MQRSLPGAFLLAPLAFAKGLDGASVMGFLAFLLRLCFCQVFLRSKAFVPGLLVACLDLKTLSGLLLPDSGSLWERLGSSCRETATR